MVNIFAPNMHFHPLQAKHVFSSEEAPEPLNSANNLNFFLFYYLSQLPRIIILETCFLCSPNLFWCYLIIILLILVWVFLFVMVQGSKIIKSKLLLETIEIKKSNITKCIIVSKIFLLDTRNSLKNGWVT